MLEQPVGTYSLKGVEWEKINTLEVCFYARRH